jgi:hypothetical protein
MEGSRAKAGITISGSVVPYNNSVREQGDLPVVNNNNNNHTAAVKEVVVAVVAGLRATPPTTGWATAIGTTSSRTEAAAAALFQKGCRQRRLRLRLLHLGHDAYLFISI